MLTAKISIDIPIFPRNTANNLFCKYLLHSYTGCGTLISFAAHRALQNERNERAKNENPNVRRRDTISYRANVLR